MSSTIDPSFELKLRRFPIERCLKTNRIIYIVGKRDTGKTVMMKHLLSLICREFDAAVGMSPTPSSRKMLAEIMPDSCIYDDFSDTTIDNLLVTLRTLTEEGNFRRVCVILDDCMYDKAILRLQQMRDIHYNGRHLEFCLINLAQYLMDVPKNIRSMVDYAFCFREDNLGNRENLRETFFGMLSKADFDAIFDKMTENNSCLVIDRTASSRYLEEFLYWFRANLHTPPFVLGNRNIWKLHHMAYVKPEGGFKDGGAPIAFLAPRKAAAPAGGAGPIPSQNRPPEKTEVSKVRQRTTRGRGGRSQKDVGMVINVKKCDSDGALLVEVEKGPNFATQPTANRAPPREVQVLPSPRSSIQCGAPSIWRGI